MHRSTIRPRGVPVSRAPVFALLFTLAAGCTGRGAGTLATSAAATGPLRQAFHVEVLNPPYTVRLVDSTNLVYELHLTSFARFPLAPARVEVLDGTTGALIHEVGDSALSALMGRPGAAAPGPDDRAVATGMRAIVYLSVPVVGAAPRSLRHRVHFQVISDAGREEAAVVGGETMVRARATPRLGPPLRGGPWVAVYDPMLERGHRRVVYAVAGRARIPGRLAVDWMRPIGIEGMDDGRGAVVLAVADAVVAAVRDDLPEGDAGRTGPVPLRDATGNYIALDLGGGTYAFYEHLRQGILVRPGDRVRRGQAIAAVGMTGSASRPHLHFHVADAHSPLGAEGLPWVMDGLQVLGGYSSIEAFGRGGPWAGRPAGAAAVPGSFHPSPNMVVAFPDGADR